MKSNVKDCRQVIEVRRRGRQGEYDKDVQYNLHKSLWLNACVFCGRDGVKKRTYFPDVYWAETVPLKERVAVRTCGSCQSRYSGTRRTYDEVKDDPAPETHPESAA